MHYNLFLAQQDNRCSIVILVKECDLGMEMFSHKKKYKWSTNEVKTVDKSFLIQLHRPSLRHQMLQASIQQSFEGLFLLLNSSYENEF